MRPPGRRRGVVGVVHHHPRRRYDATRPCVVGGRRRRNRREEIAVGELVLGIERAVLVDLLVGIDRGGIGPASPLAAAVAPAVAAGGIIEVGEYALHTIISRGWQFILLR